MNTKTCTDCGKALPATTEYFHKGGGKFGLHSSCKTCRSVRRKTQYTQDPTRVLERTRKYREKNLEKVKESHRKSSAEYREKNPEKCRLLRIASRRKASCLVYKITNTKTGHVYIGQTTIGKDRRSCHKSELRHQKHDNPPLQEDWNEHGEEAFVFEIIEELPCNTLSDVLLEKEGEYIKQYLNEGKTLYNKNRRTNV